MKDQTQYLEEVQALGWESIEQYEEAQSWYAAQKEETKRLFALNGIEWKE